MKNDKELNDGGCVVDEGTMENGVEGGGRKGDGRGERRYSDTRVSAYATAVMAFFTLCALVLSFVDSHRNQRQRVTELELSRVQNELSEVKKVSFDLIDNGIYEYVLELNNNLLYYDNYEVCRRELDELSSAIETKCNRYVMTITPFDIPTKISEEADVYVICNDLMQVVMKLQSCMSFFVAVDREESGVKRKELVKEYMGMVKLSPVKMRYDEHLQEVDEYELSFSDYCKDCGYDFEKIKLYMGLYLGSTVDEVFGEKIALYNYVSTVWSEEVDKLNAIYERLGMRMIANDMVEED